MNVKKAKGINENVVNDKLQLRDYKSLLFEKNI